MSTIKSFAVLSLTLITLTPACGGDTPSGGGKSPTDAVTLEIFSWWTSEGEAEALDALINAQRARDPKIKFVNIAVVNVGLDPQVELYKRMGLTQEGNPDPAAKANPPDLMQWDLYGVEDSWRAKGIDFASLNSVYDSEGWRGKYYPFLTKDMEYDGQILAQPVGLHRENGLMFNRQMLRDHNIAEASLTSWDGFLAACARLKEAGKTCLAVTQEGWVAWIMFRSVAAMTMGGEKFHALLTGAGDPNDPAVETAVQNFKKLIDLGYVGGWDNERKAPVAEWGWNRVREEGWDQAAKDVHAGRAAFFLHGDWAVGLYKSLGWTDTELGVMAAPGTQGLFVYGADGFLVPSASKNVSASREVVRTWGAPATLAKFNKIKGSTPPRPDVDLTGDPLAMAVAADLKQARYVMQVPVLSENENLATELASGRFSVAAAVADIRAGIAKR
jgi:glucose/mannose transport system substrate-binding protein